MKLTFVIAAVVAAAVTVPASAVTLAENLGGTDTSAQGVYWGQSFTTSAGTSWSNIAVNFYAPGGTPLAAGTGYIFSAAYAGTPNGLASAGALASASSNGSVWSFSPSFTLAAATTYHFYADAAMQLVGNNAYAGNYSFTFNPDGAFTTAGTSVNFTVTGSNVPEPASWALLITGFGLTGAAMRRRRVAVTA